MSRRNRRDFLKTTSALAAAGTLAGGLSISRSAHAAGSDLLKIGLIGCGGRGTGAAVNALSADKNCRLVAMADAFEDRLKSSLESLKKQAARMEAPDKVAVDAEHCFVGFDAGDKLIASDVDVVLLAEPPHFRPAHLKAAVAAGKQIFCEKPVAVDPWGVRDVMATVEEAKKKNLNLVAGLCWRYDLGVRETMKRVLDGAIGRIKCIQENYLASTLSHRPRKPEQTELEYQLRNWQFFVWLSGDYNIEQHIHSLDKAAWAMGDVPPARAWGMGGRLLRNPKQGDIYDHHSVVYEYPDREPVVYSFCRQMQGCAIDVSDIFIGEKGQADILKHEITGENPWRYTGPKPSMYDVEHQELFAAIRSGKTINNGDYLAKSTMWGILGRMTNYAGHPMTWQEALESPLHLVPDRYAFDARPPVVPDADGNYPCALPGVK
jgi:predicted dehydrogenase